KARALLRQAGFGPENPLQITHKTSSNPFRIRLASVIQAQLKEVGVEVTIQSYDWGTFYGDIKAGRFQMFSLSWVGIKTPDIFRYVFHSNSIPPAGANRGRFLDAYTDQLIEQAEQTTILDEQAAFYRKLQLHLHEQLPYVPLWYEGRALVTSPKITGYQTFMDGRYDALLHTVKQIQ
ncbi:MAG: ABC transporter substrate-binding protein, partial [Pseudomonadota bacterium]